MALSFDVTTFYYHDRFPVILAIRKWYWWYKPIAVYGIQPNLEGNLFNCMLPHLAETIISI